MAKLLSARAVNFVLLGLVAMLLAGGFYGVDRLGGWRYLAHRLHTIEAWPTYTQRVSQLELFAIPRAGIVLLGDSHIAYGEWHEWLAQHRIYNRGVPAEGSERLLSADYFQHLVEANADTFLLQVGTNDLLFDSDLPDAYTKLVTKITSDSAHVLLLCTLPGVNNEVRWTGIDEADVAQANARIRALSSEYRNVVLLDVAAALGTVEGKLPASLTDDGVHLRGEGYSIWSKLIDTTLRERESLPQKD